MTTTDRYSSAPMQRRDLLILLCALILTVFCINDSGLWDDETIRIREIHSDFCTNLKHSLTQLQPLHMALLWVWGQFTGDSAFWIRLLNLIAIIPAIVYCIRILRKLNISPWFALIIPLHPMVAYYVNDISPYIFLLSASFASVYYLFFSLQRHSTGNVVRINLIFAFGYALHFIFVFFYIITAATVLINALRRRDTAVLRRYVGIFLLFSPLFFFLTYLFLTYMSTGQVRGWAAPGWENIAYVLYSFAGFQGLGLSRSALRFGEFEQLTPVMAALLGAGFLVALVCLIAGRRYIISLLRQEYILPLCIYTVVFIAVAHHVHFRYWERHAMILLPFVLIFALQCVDAARRQTGRPILFRIICLLTGSVLLTSTLRLTFLPYHYKDDSKGLFAGFYTADTLTVCQCYWFTKKFYHVPYTSAVDYLACEETTDVVPKVIDCGEVPYRTLFAVLQKAAQQNDSVQLVLFRRNEWTPGLYDHAEEHLHRAGFEILNQQEYQALFRIIRLRAAADARQPSPVS